MNDAQSASFGKFSPSAKIVLLASQRYAEAMGNVLGSEHLLLAISITPDTYAYNLLRKVPITPDQIRLALSLKEISSERGMGMKIEAKAVLERAAFQATTLGMQFIEPEHLLWALISDTNSRAHEIVLQLGIEPKTIRKSLEHFFAEQKSSPNTMVHQEIELLGVVGQLSQEPIPSTHRPQLNLPEEVDEQTETPFLDEFTLDLTALAHEKLLDPLIGREAELERLMHILGRKTKNNPVLIGEPGVGKTAIIEGLAQRIVGGAVPEYLADSRIVSLELSILVAGTMYRGQFEDRLRHLVEEVQTQGDILLFIDELHTMTGAGGAEGALDAANILKPLLAKGQLRLIGATTSTEYQKYIEKDAALERRFQPIVVSEPTQLETVEILKGLTPKYEAFHGIGIPSEVIEETVTLAHRYIHDRNFPDKAIDLIDEAAAAMRAKNTPAPRRRATAHDIERELKRLKNQKEYELKTGHIERAAYLRDQEIKLRLLQKEADPAQLKTPPTRAKSLTLDHIRHVLSTWTKIPIERLGNADRRNLLKLEESLQTKILGQTESLKTLAQTIRRAKSGLKSPNRPIGAFLFVGPSGVGKTETARVLAEEIFGTEDALIKLDMSEFMERHQVARLLGAPPGYVGHDEPAKLLESVRRRPHRLVLFDEIEKAHPDVFHLLLQMMEDGILTDSKGRAVSFRETLIILTSNIGGELWKRAGGIGFRVSSQTPWWQTPLQDQLKEHFRPEFLNRLDNILIFQPLAEETLRAIVQLELDRLKTYARSTSLEIMLTPEAENWLIAQIVANKEGARAIRRLIETHVATLVADASLRFPTRHEFQIDLKGKTLAINARQRVLTT
ncbi:ATP-dependent Clp protease ATP-binding subunit [Candidatus Berkelbacteria bacterium]|nr:ATP-dependent Clp protease ATP-binding subunit [Candidatus Berkelbacteria bacterium]